MSTSTDVPLRRVPCPHRCAADPALWAHHDRLLRVETDLDEVLELLELAVTWAELDYSEVALIGPARWVDFALQHRWGDPERVLRIFSLATDIAARPPATRAVRMPELAVALAG